MHHCVEACGKPGPVYRWWGRMNAVHWRQDFPGFSEWFISRCLPEPHSTKAIEDGVGWALETDPETLIATARGEWLRDRRTLRTLAEKLDCPVLVIHGDRDRITPLRDGRALARIGGGSNLSLKPRLLPVRRASGRRSRKVRGSFDQLSVREPHRCDRPRREER